MLGIGVGQTRQRDGRVESLDGPSGQSPSAAIRVHCVADAALTAMALSGMRQGRLKGGVHGTYAESTNHGRCGWLGFGRHLDDGAVPIDNNSVENQIRPWALGRSNWLFAGSLRSGKRAAAIMSLIQSARMNGHDPHAYLKDVLTRLPTQQASEIELLLPHQWVSG